MRFLDRRHANRAASKQLQQVSTNTQFTRGNRGMHDTVVCSIGGNALDLRKLKTSTLKRDKQQHLAQSEAKRGRGTMPSGTCPSQIGRDLEEKQGRPADGAITAGWLGRVRANAKLSHHCTRQQRPCSAVTDGDIKRCGGRPELPKARASCRPHSQLGQLEQRSLVRTAPRSIPSKRSDHKETSGAVQSGVTMPRHNANSFSDSQSSGR